MAKISRRQLGLVALGTPALARAENQVDAAAFDPVAWTIQRHAEAPLRLTFKAQNRQQAEAWQRLLRAKVRELLGGLDAGRGDLKPQTLEVHEFPRYRREKFVFESRPGVGVLGYLLLPNGAAAPAPAVVCVPGHGRGVDDIVGIDEQGRDRIARTGYAYDFAIQVAEQGVAAVAIEVMGFGFRRDGLTKAKGATAAACQPAAGSALLLGETMLGWRVWDVMRTIDWIETRKELDRGRVGCVGISGGGTCTLFAAALDPRIRAAMVSGYVNTFRDSIMSLSHCIDNYVPGILNWAEQYDVAGLIAPRPLFVESGARDPIFPIEASRESFARIRKVYETMGAAAALGQEIFDGPHEFHGARGLPFLAGRLKA